MIALAAKPFCAICTRDIVGRPRLSPIGKGDALVTLCRSCDEEQDEQLAALATSTKTRRFTPHGMPAPRARAESAARMIRETGCTGAHAARTHNVSRCYANEVYRELYPNAPRRSRARKDQ